MDTYFIWRSCNQLCKLTPSAYKSLVELEEPITVIHKRINFLEGENNMIEGAYIPRKLNTSNGIYIDSLKN